MIEQVPALSDYVIADLLAPYHPPLSPPLLARLSLYLDLLLKWNARTNLTAIRGPGEIVTRHFGESLFAAQHLGNPQTLLDYGTGAGFPGIPIALVHPEIRVTLAESQQKKCAFLQEAARTLDLRASLWTQRVEAMPATSRFDCIALRAVDNIDAAILSAASRTPGTILLMTSSSTQPVAPPGYAQTPPIPIPASSSRCLLLLRHTLR